jgi:hypothetical protein
VIAALDQQEQLADTQALALKTTPPAPLRLVMEQRLEKAVSLEGEDITIQGIADYAIYYENPRKDKYATGLVAMEAKKGSQAGLAMGQLIAYMGMIHWERKERGREICVVWGFASDGYEYIFCRVDRQGLFSRTNVLSFDEQGHSLIFGLLCGIFNAAALSSPTTSPIKDPETRQKLLANFGSPERGKKFDYGVSEDNYGLQPVPEPVLEGAGSTSEGGIEGERSEREEKA